MNRETKTSVDPTQAFPTAVSRNHQIANAPAPTVASMAAPVKTKAQAVVSPLPRTIAQKKVNINTVVSRFSYSNEPENPQVSFYWFCRKNGFECQGLRWVNHNTKPLKCLMEFIFEKNVIRMYAVPVICL